MQLSPPKISPPKLPGSGVALPTAKLGGRAALPFLVVVVALLVLLAGSIYFLGEFLKQNRQIEQNQGELARLNASLLTATPAAENRARLQTQLETAREQLDNTTGLPGAGGDVEVAVLERILAAAARSGVEVSTLRQKAGPIQEGSLVEWQYDLAATGDLGRLTDFVARLEQEAFPAAYVSEPRLSENANGSYLLGGVLTVYGSTLSSQPMTTPEGPPMTGQELRTAAAEALATQDYERALSLLLRLKGQEPTASDVDLLLYNAYVAYGQALLAQGNVEGAREQCAEASKINPNGQEAVLCLVAVSQHGGSPTATTLGGTAVIQTPGAGQTPGVGSPTPDPNAAANLTPTSVPTVELPPTRTPAPAPPPQPTATQAPPATFTPAPLVTETPAATAGPSPTEGPSPTATVYVTPNPNPFGAMGTFYLPNCGLTQIKGTIRNASGAAVNGVTVRVWYDGAASNEIYSLPSGTDNKRGAGEWDVVLAEYPKPGTWYIAVVDRTTGAILSDVVTAVTDDGPCKPGESGRQVVIQDFLQFGQVTTAPGTPSATAVSGTPAPTATATVSPTPTATVSPTATALPYRYDNSVNPDRDIPDGPGGVITSTMVITDQVIIRELRVFPNITHNDVSDLQIDLVHPDGTRIRIHKQGDSQGTSLRRWFDITGAALSLVKGKSAAGTWTLEITDTIEGQIGKLLSWTLEIYP